MDYAGFNYNNFKIRTSSRQGHISQYGWGGIPMSWACCVFKKEIVMCQEKPVSENSPIIIYPFHARFGYCIGKFFRKKIYLDYSAVKFMDMYAKKKGITKSFEKACYDFMINDFKTDEEHQFEYIHIFRELIKLKYLRHIGKYIHKDADWIPNEEVVLTKRGLNWIECNHEKGDFFE